MRALSREGGARVGRLEIEYGVQRRRVAQRQW